MKMALKGNTLIIVEASPEQFQVITSWHKMTWDRKTMRLTGTADMELLDRLAGIVRLPQPLEERRARFRAVADAVDAQRANETPTPLYPYPVKMPLYAHQVRGANMAMLTFGFIEPKGGETQ